MAPQWRRINRKAQEWFYRGSPPTGPCQCQHDYRTCTKHEIVSVEKLSQEHSDWWKQTWLDGLGSGRCQMRKMMLGNTQKAARTAVLALTCWTICSPSCVYIMHTHLLFHPLTDWCCYFFSSTPTGSKKCKSNSSVQSSPPTSISLESAEPILQILMSSCRLMAIHSQ